jgi:hypothetical protein
MPRARCGCISLWSSNQESSSSSTVVASGLGWSWTWSRLKVFTNASAIPFDSGLPAGVVDGGAINGHEPDRVSERDRLVRREAAAVVSQPLHRLRGSERAEVVLDGERHEVAHGDATDAARTGGPGEDPAVVGVDREGDPHSVAVPAGDLEHVGGPASVGGGCRDLAVVRSLPAATGVQGQQQAGPLHHR